MNHFEETKELLKNSKFYYIITTNMEGVYTYANDYYESLFSTIHGSIVGRSFEITMHADDVSMVKEISMQAIMNPKRSFPIIIRKHDGQGGFVITQWEFKAMFDDNGAPTGIFCLGHDVSDVVTSHMQLDTAMQELNTHKEIIQNLSFNHSHIYRRPLANILGLANMLQTLELNDEAKEICNLLLKSAIELDEEIKGIVPG